MTIETASAVQLRKFATEVLRSGELWGVVDAEGWQKLTNNPFESGRTQLWTSRSAAEKGAQAGTAKRICLSDFLYEFAEDAEMSREGLVLYWSGEEGGSKSTVSSILNALKVYAAKINFALPGRPEKYCTSHVRSREAGSITFAVDDVTPATTALPLEKGHQAFRRRANSDLESCCDYHSDVVANIDFHPLIAAVDRAFSEHRPLVVSPDVIWLTIAQGLSHHILNNAESLRSRFVLHEGKQTLTARCDGFVKGSPENPWGEVIGQFSEQIRGHIQSDAHALFVADFSTTGTVERVASEIVLMEAMQHYFDYRAMAVCGIPSITLQGTVEDWERIRARVDRLSEFGLEWWAEKLRPVCDEFVAAARGQIDVRHWRRIYKLIPAYGMRCFNGWIGALIPYVGHDGVPRMRNGYFSGETMNVKSMPNGLALAPFVFETRNGETETRWPMEFIAGFSGVEQNPKTLALRPKIGWAVRDGDPFTQLFQQMQTAHVVLPALAGEWQCGYLDGVPGDLQRFLTQCDGALLFGRSGAPRFTLFGRKQVQVLRTFSLLTPDGCKDEDDWMSRGRQDGEPVYLLKVGDCSDGGVFAIDTGRHRKGDWPVIYFKRGGTVIVGECPVVAGNFTEVMGVLMKTGDRPFVPAEACKKLQDV